AADPFGDALGAAPDVLVGVVLADPGTPPVGTKDDGRKGCRVVAHQPDGTGRSPPGERPWACHGYPASDDRSPRDLPCPADGPHLRHRLRTLRHHDAAP